MVECCFCSEDIAANEKGSLALVVVAAQRSQDPAAPRQGLQCHARCLRVRLRPDVPFDTELFDD